MEPPLRILVVDDEDAFRKNLVRMLTSQGMDAVGAADGEQALQLIKLDDFHVVLLDLKMPGISGEQVMRCLRDQGAVAEVIVLTGHASLDSAVALIAEGAFDYLLKPYVQADLLRTIELAAEKRQLKRSFKQELPEKKKGRRFKIFS